MTSFPAIARDKLHGPPDTTPRSRAAPASRDAQGPHEEGKAKIMLRSRDTGTAACPPSLVSNLPTPGSSSILREMHPAESSLDSSAERKLACHEIALS